jgi:hypothetical protein
MQINADGLALAKHAKLAPAQAEEREDRPSEHNLCELCSFARDLLGFCPVVLQFDF